QDCHRRSAGSRSLAAPCMHGFQYTRHRRSQGYVGPCLDKPTKIIYARATKHSSDAMKKKSLFPGKHRSCVDLEQSRKSDDHALDKLPAGRDVDSSLPFDKVAAGYLFLNALSDLVIPVYVHVEKLIRKILHRHAGSAGLISGRQDH